ncbi:membrane protein [Chania multitudinisentens RB-25]|uniref:Membrane protein n=1 Tax=Chania multitudinisentens RB-25 TaxID=1441930 RepID=W0L497_9GAMM|nr:fimbria/pilus outer membrane usher protein [Chania multitudinisentens]AHG18588.1 membrane protein [Chania multitudinisentens RB-25]
MIMQRVSFHSLISAFVLLPTVATAANEKSPTFDLKTLEALGYTADVADFFSQEARFLPGVNTVTIQINAARSYTVDARFDADGQLCVDQALLIALKLRQPKLASDCEPLSALWPTATSKAYPGQFRLELMLPEEAFDPSQDDFQRGGYAALLNYNLFGQQISGGNDLRFFQGILEPGLNVSNWVVRNRSSVSSGLNADRYTSEETSASRAVESLKSVLQLGQFGSNSDSFSGLPMLGAQLYSDSAQFSASQLIVPIKGIANTNATVEIRQRGRTIYRTVVAPGPFSLNSISNFSNGVPADVEIIEEDGRRQRFSVTNALDVNNYREATSYQLGLGRYRNPNSTVGTPAESPSLITGEVAFSPANRQRMTTAGLFASEYQNLTLKHSYTGTERGWLAGGLSYARAQDNRQGYQLDMQAQTTLGGNVSTSFSSLYRSEDYLTADETLSGQAYRQAPTTQTLRNANSAAITWAHPRWGAFSYVASHNQYYHNGKSDIAHTLSSSQRWGRATVSLSLQSSAFGETAYASLSLPLGQGTLNNRVQSVDNNLSLGSSYQGTWGENRGYTVGVTGSEQQQRVSGSANLRTPYAQLATGVSQSSNQSRSVSMSASGAVAYANGSAATSSQPIGDTFAIVSIPKQGNLRVQAPGSGATLTNYSGNAILPALQPYTTATAQIDTKTLPLNIRLNSTTADFALARGSVASKLFTVTETRQLLLTIRDANGVAIPVGASVLSSSGQFMGTVIGDGNVMLINDDIGQPLRIKVTNQSECQVDYQAPTQFDANAVYETAEAICR